MDTSISKFFINVSLGFSVGVQVWFSSIFLKDLWNISVPDKDERSVVEVV